MFFQTVDYSYSSIVLVCFIGITLIYSLLLGRNDRREKFLKKIPGLPRLPFIGAALAANVPNEELYKVQFKYTEKYGERFFFNTFGFYAVALTNPDDLEKLLSSSVHISKGLTYGVVIPWLGDGLLMSTGEKWQKRRKMLTPSFHFRILEDFLGTFNEQAQILIEALRKGFQGGKELNICPFITRCTLDIIGETAMGKKLNTQSEVDSLYLRAVNRACEIQVARALKPYLWYDWIFKLTPAGREYTSLLKTLHNFTDEVIKEKKFDYKLKTKVSPNLDENWYTKRRAAFLDTLLEAQINLGESELSDLDIREEVDTFMFEGHDTVSASLNWTIFLLGCHPQYQAKVHEELDLIFGDNKTRPISSKELAEMKYLEMCIKESLRLFPSVPVMARSLTSDLQLDKDFTIPANCDIILLTMPIHRNEKIYPSPETYLPDRFLPENTLNRHNFAFIPFSAGPRNCIGQKFAMMEEKVLLANIFRNFQVEAAEPLEDVTVMLEIVTRPKNGLKIRLHPR